MNYKPKEMILTAGPEVTKKDVQYVTDAVLNGWNFHHSDYIAKFEKAFAAYIGVAYALAVPTGTSALHLGLHLAGVGIGDEVIIPDMTYVACSNAAHYLGATPILVDIDKETWSIDVNKVEEHITKKTKVIMPVHLYGNVANLDEIQALAKAYNLKIVDDSCEGLGCTLNGVHVGSQAQAAAFSFQGAKLVAIGEGGMFVTNNKEWYTMAVSLVDHGVNPARQFWADRIGYMYPMSNIQAALGLSRLEAINELIERKRRIFHWYKERLSDIETIDLNPERPGVRSSFWMSSLVLKTNKISRDGLRAKLKEAMIDTRPFFYPISDFGLYKTKGIKTPIAHEISLNGINLPCGVKLEEKTVDYIAAKIREFIV